MEIAPIARLIMAIATAAGIMATATSTVAREGETAAPPAAPIGTSLCYPLRCLHKGVFILSESGQPLVLHETGGFLRLLPVAGNERCQTLCAAALGEDAFWRVSCCETQKSPIASSAPSEKECTKGGRRHRIAGEGM